MYVRARGGLGFTPEQETELLTAQRAYGPKIDKLVEQAEAAERIRLFTIIATIGGALYTLARMGELIVDWRMKRRPGEGVKW